MKKCWMVICLILTFMLFNNVVDAASVPKASSGIDYSSCLAFSDSFKTILNSEGSYYYKYCYRATCGNNVYNKANLVPMSGYRCQNGNGTPYKVMDDGCAKYSGSCSDKRSYYCTKVEYVDCNRLADGSKFTGSETKPTEKTTTKKPTTKKPTTTTKTPSSTTSTTTTTKTNEEPTTAVPPTVAKKNNTNIKVLTINNVDIGYNNSKLAYAIKLPYDVTEVDIHVELEDSSSKYTIEGNTNMPNEDHTITINVTAEDGSTRTVTISVRRYSGENNDCTLANIYMDEYSLDFSKTVYNYRLRIPKNVRSLNLQIVPSDELNTRYEVTGNEDLKNNSKIKIISVAQDGTECTYTITIKKNSDTWKYVLLIVILGAILGTSIYFLLKYLRKSKGKYKYE